METKIERPMGEDSGCCLGRHGPSGEKQRKKPLTTV